MKIRLIMVRRMTIEDTAIVLSITVGINMDGIIAFSTRTVINMMLRLEGSFLIRKPIMIMLGIEMSI